MSEFASMSDASSAAMAFVEAAPEPASADTSSAPAPSAPADPSLAPDTPPAANIPSFDGTRHKVKVRGTEEEVPYEELLKGYSRQADYTRSKQELAEQARQMQLMDQQVRAMQQQLQTVYGNDPLLTQAAQVAEQYQVPFSQALQALVAAQSQQTGQAPQMDSGEIATVAQAQAIAEQRLAAMQHQMGLMQQQLQGWTQQQIEAAKGEIVTSQQAQAYTNDINTTLGELFAQQPILGAVEGMEDILRFKVYQANPATVEEAKDLFIRFGHEQAEKLTSQFTSLNKDRLAQKQKLTTGGIEPSGGTGITPQPTGHAFGSKALRDAAESYIKNMMQ